MPQKRFIADALSVVTICLVAVLVLLGECLQMLHRLESGIRRTMPVSHPRFSSSRIVTELVVIVIGPKYKDKLIPKLPSYFITAAVSSDTDIALCTYPLLSTISLGLFATVLTGYLFWLGRRILHLIINKGLQKRVYALLFSISSFFPLRVLLLGLSVLSKPENAVFDAIVFLSFLSLICCVGVGICILVYFPIADSLALRSSQIDIEARTGDVCNDTISLIANQGPVEGSIVGSPVRNSNASENSGSISFHCDGKR
ncbi:hypothetical protein DH2020_024131 [Rehmannia glutinosa]|uniref:Transmembrane protein n=1 Tax=Rehmannia glutinosa TaxID=99300 RepID=A0ABR0W7Y4_REHGL